MVILYKKI